MSNHDDEFVVREMSEEEINNIRENIVMDENKRFAFYEKLRKKLKNIVPKKSGKANKITDYLFLLPDFFILLCRLAADARVPKNQKIFIASIIGYVILPIDILPDFIPFIGFMDDLVLVILALNEILNHIDQNVLLDNWSGEKNILQLLRQLVLMVDMNLNSKVLTRIRQWINKNKRN